MCTGGGFQGPLGSSGVAEGQATMFPGPWDIGVARFCQDAAVHSCKH